MSYENPQMKCNPGLKKYEPDLPTIKKGKEPEISLTKFVLILLEIIALAILMYFLIK